MRTLAPRQLGLPSYPLCRCGGQWTLFSQIQHYSVLDYSTEQKMISKININPIKPENHLIETHNPNDSHKYITIQSRSPQSQSLHRHTPLRSCIPPNSSPPNPNPNARYSIPPSNNGIIAQHMFATPIHLLQPHQPITPAPHNPIPRPMFPSVRYPINTVLGGISKHSKFSVWRKRRRDVG